MSEWTRYKLKDISSLSNGINFDKSAYTSGVKLIEISCLFVPMETRN